MIESATLVSSRYNFFLPSSEGSLLYNSKSGAVMLLKGEDSSQFARMIGESVAG
jgi:hypothetical protein